MHLQHGSDETAVLLLYEEAAYADLGTTTPELIITRPRATVVKFVRLTRSVPINTQNQSRWFWATAPPRRAA